MPYINHRKYRIIEVGGDTPNLVQPTYVCVEDKMRNKSVVLYADVLFSVSVIL